MSVLSRMSALTLLLHATGAIAVTERCNYELVVEDHGTDASISSGQHMEEISYGARSPCKMPVDLRDPSTLNTHDSPRA